MLDSEDDDDGPVWTIQEERKHGDRLVLHDPANLTAILTWYQTGGMARGVTLTEARELPDEFVSDLLMFLSEMGRQRKQRRGSNPK